MKKRLIAMKENLASCIEYQLHHIDDVDCCELGEAIDMLKDLEEAIYFCTITEAMNGGGKYGGGMEFEMEYKKNNGHHQNGDSQYYGGNGNGGNQSYYNGNGSGRSYNDGNNGSNMSQNYYGGNGQNYYDGNNQSYYGGYPMMYYQGRDSQGRFTSGNGSSSSDYSEPMYMRDEREGRSPQNRRMYMEAKHTKDKATQLRELEKYMQELTSDMVEMIQDASSEEKQYLEKKISALASKIGQMK